MTDLWYVIIKISDMSEGAVRNAVWKVAIKLILGTQKSQRGIYSIMIANINDKLYYTI